jgi:O-antigen/teichoic acid export membrane protein
MSTDKSAAVPGAGRPWAEGEAPTQPAVVTPLRVAGRTLARNSLLNLIGRVIPMVVAVLTMPYVVRQLGPDRFGILSLDWLAVGYLSLFNLGIGPAVTKFVAELLGKGANERIPELVWTAVVTQLCLGILVGTLLVAVTPELVAHVIRIPSGLRGETQSVFLILAASFPISFAAGPLQGLIAAKQRFDLWNAVYVPAGALNYLLPVAVLALGYKLRTIVLLLVLTRLASLCILFLICFRLYPSIRANFRFSRPHLRRLLGYGGWVSVSGAIGPILDNFDDFLIGAVVSISALGYYTPPSLISSRLVIVQSGLAATLLPAFSASVGRGDARWMGNVFARSLKLHLLLIGLASVLLGFFARPILTVWLGTTFCEKGAVALQILAVGVFMNSLALIPGSLLYGVGRPDLPAKFHLLELPIHVALAWLLVTHFGLPGAALAWTIRATLDTVLLIAGACWVTQMPAWSQIGRPLMRPLAVLTALVLCLSLFWASEPGLGPRIFLTLMILFAGFLPAVWHYALDTEERLRTRLWLGLAR